MFLLLHFECVNTFEQGCTHLTMPASAVTTLKLLYALVACVPVVSPNYWGKFDYFYPLKINVINQSKFEFQSKFSEILIKTNRFLITKAVCQRFAKHAFSSTKMPWK